MSERFWSPRTLDEAVDTAGPQPHPRIDQGEVEKPAHTEADPVVPITIIERPLRR